MYAFDAVLAVALLTAPGGDLPADSLAPWFAALRGALTDVAVRAEVLDARETRYVLTRPEDFAADLNLLRRRARDLAGAPPADDARRFPAEAVIQELLLSNRAYRRHLDARRAVEHSLVWSLREVIQETDELHQIWDTLRQARSEHQHVTARRHALRKLRDLVGAEAYYAGALPPGVPVWRFERIE